VIELSPPLKSISERTQERLGVLRDSQRVYEPNESVYRNLGHKTLIPVVGPSSAGKSVAIDETVRLDSRFGPVRSFSTRDPRSDDTPETMVCLPWDEQHIKRICNTIDAGDAVQYVFHPKTGDVYGTTLDSYPKEYNLLPALSNSVAAMEKLPFRAVLPVGIVAPPEIWAMRFETREFSSADDRKARLAEAAISTAWLLEHPHVAIINNQEGEVEHTATQIRDYALSQGSATPPRDEVTARELLNYIRSIS